MGGLWLKRLKGLKGLKEFKVERVKGKVAWRGGGGLSINSQCPTIGNAINDNGNWREGRAELGLGLGLALVDTGGIGSWWTMSAAGGSGAPHSP